MELSIVEGRAHNRLYRKGAVAAHLVASPGRLLVAFPAGNSGAALWLSPSVELSIEGPIEPIEGGIAARIVASDTFAIERAVLGSLRAVRGHAEIDSPAIQKKGDRTILGRAMRDGHRIEVALIGDGRAFTLEARVDEPPLTPLPIEVLTREVLPMTRDLEALAFLAYEEKLLAGSWRFLTYFGRDTLLSLALLMDVAGERLIEAGLGSVIARLASDGAVAHEEAVGEWPALSGAAPLDYHMVDDDFLLAPVVASYFARAPQRRDAFLVRHGDALMRNLELCLARATPYARERKPTSLVAVRSAVGQWRDSAMGLGGGRYPYDVNAVFVPAALRAATQLGTPAIAKEAQRVLAAWRDVADHFDVTIDQVDLHAFCAARGLSPLKRNEPMVFPALALDDHGAPLPVMHSDESFALLFDKPIDPASSAERMLRPFPEGLLTPVGLLVANPAFAPALWSQFTERHYHGTVVWSWQQALLAIALDRQLARLDLTGATRTRLMAASNKLAAAMSATRDMRTSELWTFSVAHGRIELVPFGQAEGHTDESNAVQLWSTVQLALDRHRPR